MNRAMFLVGNVTDSFVVFRITGASEAEIRKEITSPGYRVYEEGSPDCPEFLESRKSDVHKCDWNSKSQFLQSIIFWDRMEREGKSNYSVRGKLKDGRYQHRFVYAKSVFQLLWRYPRLRLYYYGPIYGEIGCSDVDVEDDYLRQFKWFRI
jgi:hypothetical protein